ncbi:plasmid pRiA4b ORF-3 family protein [Corynebacterium sp. ZY180755]
MSSVTISVELTGIEPAPRCMRTLEVPLEANLFGLHNAIQAAFGWENAHLYQFSVPILAEDGPRIMSRFQDDFDDVDVAADEVLVGDYLKNLGDQLTYVYDFGDWWEHTITVVGVGGRQRKRAKLVTMQGPAPIEDCRTAPGGWAGVWKAISSLYETRSFADLHEAYERLDADGKDIVDWLGGPEAAYWYAADRIDLDARAFANDLKKVDLFAQEWQGIDPENLGFAVDGIDTLDPEVAMSVAKLAEKANYLVQRGVDPQKIMDRLADVPLDKASDPDIVFEGLEADAHLEDIDGLETNPLDDPYVSRLDGAVLDKIVDETSTGIEVVLRVVEELAPFPEVARVLKDGLANYPLPELDYKEIELFVTPIRECLRIIGGDEASNTLDELVEENWKEFGEILGQDLDDEDQRILALRPYLISFMGLGLMEPLDFEGRMELTQQARGFIAEADFAMSEDDKRVADRKLFDYVVAHFPYDKGPEVTLLATFFAFDLAQDELKQLAYELNVDAEMLFETTMHAVFTGVGLADPAIAGVVDGYFASHSLLINLPGFIYPDEETGMKKVSPAGARFLSMCLSGLTDERVIPGLYAIVPPGTSKFSQEDE